MLNASTPTKELIEKWNAAENMLEAVRQQAEETKAEVLDILCARKPEAACAFLRAQAAGEKPKMKDHFKE